MAEDLDQRLSRIKRKIAENNAALSPPCTIREVEEFEAKHRVRLPEEFRRFILEIGNGGDGPPEYGLLPLGRVSSDLGEEFGVAHKNLHLPFPLTLHWIWEDDEEEKPELRDAVEYGRLHLGTDGCTMNWILIVTGPQRGRVWQTADVGIQPCAPPRDFLSWYEYWLDGGDDWWAEFQS